MRGANVPSGPAARPTDHTLAVPGTGASRGIEEPPSPATSGSPYSVNVCPFQARKAGPGTRGTPPGGPHFWERATDAQPSAPDGVDASEVTAPKSAGTVTRLHVCPSKRANRGGTGRPGGPPMNPAVPPAHTSAGETAGTVDTADLGKPSTTVCRHVCPSPFDTAALAPVAPAAHTSWPPGCAGRTRLPAARARPAGRSRPGGAVPACRPANRSARSHRRRRRPRSTRHRGAAGDSLG